MAFYGESYPIYDGKVLTPAGATFPYSEMFYHFEGGSTVWSAGEAFVVNMDPTAILNLEETSEAVVSFVIETLDSSSGVLRLHYGMDPTYAGDETVATTSLGDYVIHGTETVVSTATGITAAQLWSAAESPLLKVEVLTGSVEITQVKLRVWPPGGPSGSWTMAAGYSTTQQGTLWKGTLALGQGNGDGTEYGTAQAAIDPVVAEAAADLMTIVGTTRQWSLSSGSAGGGSLGAQANSFGDPIDHWESDFAQFLVYYSYLLATAYPTPSPQVSTSGFDPREIWLEEMAEVRSASGGAPTPGAFGGWTGSIMANGSHSSDPTEHSPDHATADVVTLPGYPDVVQINSTTIEGPWVMHSTGAGVSIPDGLHSVEVPIAGGPYLALCVTPPGMLGGTVAMGSHPSSVISDANLDSSTLDATYVVEHGAYQYFDASLPWADEGGTHLLPPGQFLLANPDLSGAAGGVDVNFATS